jgi:hypothetical protein
MLGFAGIRKQLIKKEKERAVKGRSVAEAKSLPGSPTRISGVQNNVS